MRILNIGAGKILPLSLPDEKENLLFGNTIVNLDNMYFNATSISCLSGILEELKLKTEPNELIYINHDIYEFLEKFVYEFDRVTIYRFLEHVPKVKLLYFLYELSTVVKVGGLVDVIVPDFELLAKRILSEDVKASNFEAEDIITTFELLNEPYCPHASIWTVQRMSHFLELEGRFKIVNYQKNYNFDGRNIYLRFQAERIK